MNSTKFPLTEVGSNQLNIEVSSDINLDKSDSIASSFFQNGYCHIRLRNPNLLTLSEVKTFYFKLVSKFVQPIRVFDRIDDIWRTIGVKTYKDPNASEGTGESPLHMDFVNSTSPPDLVGLLCVNPDPLGGGTSLVSDYRSVLNNIPKNIESFLKHEVFNEGMFIDLINIGKEWNPFPVLSDTNAFRFRFTEKLQVLNPDSVYQIALDYLRQRLRSNMLKIHLLKYDMLLLNQKCVLHGKTALGEDQNSLPLESQRKLLHLFGRI